MRIRNSNGKSLSFVEKIVYTLKFFRFRTCMPGMIAYLIGWGLTGESFHWKVLIGSFLSFLFQAGANLNNTITDLKEDSYNLPKRLNLIEEYGYKNLIIITIIVDVAILILPIFINIISLIITVMGIFWMLGYSLPPLRFKANPIMSMVTFAQGLAGPYALGFFTREYSIGLSSLLNAQFYTMEFWGIFILLELWFFLYCPMKNIPDFDGDKYAELKTTATIFSTRENAAVVAVIAHLLSYTILAFLIFFKLIAFKFIILFIWLPVSAYIFIGMVVDKDVLRLNNNMKNAMVYATGYCSTILILNNLTVWAVLYITLAFVGIFFTDNYSIDSRPIVIPEEYKGSN